MRDLTSAMKPVLSKVLGPPDEQLEPETRKQLLELVEYIKQQG
jgi:importin-4